MGKSALDPLILLFAGRQGVDSKQSTGEPSDGHILQKLPLVPSNEVPLPKDYIFKVLPPHVFNIQFLQITRATRR